MYKKIISSMKKLCACCMEEHEVQIVEVQEQNIFKNIPIEYTAEYAYCDNADELYMEEEMIRVNDIRMKDAYRKAVGLMTSAEINSVRVKYGITQRDLCVLLGWGEKTITRYESHQVQDRAHDEILKKLEKDPEWFLCLLVETHDTIPNEYYQRYFKTATLLYEGSREQYLRKAIYALYAPLYDSAKYLGNVPLALDKVVDMISYFADSDKVTGLYKVKLMKLMWYADFLSYKLRGSAITGLAYQALPMGAVPLGHDSIIQLRGVCCEEVDMGEGTGYHFLPSENSQYPNLTEEDKRILDIVIEKFGTMSKKELVAYMHKEQAYQVTVPRAMIDYKYAATLSLAGGGE